MTADHAAIRARRDAIWLMAQDAISNIDQPGLDASEWEYKARGHVSDLYALGAQSSEQNEVLLALIDTRQKYLDSMADGENDYTPASYHLHNLVNGKDD